MMYQHILVPLDGSDNSKQALAEAIALAKTFGSSVTLLTVINEGSFYITAGNVPYNYSDELKRRAEEIEAEGKRVAEAAGINVNTVVLKGIPKNIIATFSDDADIDLIVIGKSGADALDRLLIGSTTAYVVRNTKVRVLVVNEDEHK